MFGKMGSKRKPNNGVNSAENDISQSSSTSVATVTLTPAVTRMEKVPDAEHGLKFESKLLVLFCIRALGAGYTFELTKQREDLGGKFDDVIFRYQVLDDSPEGKHWRYRYLQAKHKLNELDKIKANDVLQDNDKGDFSLLKYFRSFCKMKARGEDIHDCILCTNIAFDVNNLNEKGIAISLQDQAEDILKFGPPERTARYKLKLTEELRLQKLNEWSATRCLAKELQNCVQNQTTTEIRTGILSSYHVALIKEHVIDLATKKFHTDFVTETRDLSNGAKDLRQAINELVKNDDWKTWKFKLSNIFGKNQSAVKMDNLLPLEITDADVVDFFDKLVFVVDMPNEKRFEKILQTQDVSKYYPKSECSDQTLRILHKMPNKFAGKVVGYWLTSEEGKKILLAGITKVSLEDQKQLQNEVGFNEVTNGKMADKLKDLLCSEKTIEQIETSSPTYTSVKVISAIKILNSKPAVNINYLVTSSTKLQVSKDDVRWRNIFQLPNESSHFVLVVCDDGEQLLQDDFYANLFPVEEEKTKRKKVMVISRNGAALTSDVIDYTQLSDSFKQKIQSKTVSFQGTNECVGHLVGTKPEDVIDSLEELLRPEEEQIVIKSFDSTRFEKSLYIKRRMKFAFDDNFNAKLARRLNCTEDKLHGECRISSRGQIEWFVDGKRRKEIWEKVVTMSDQASGRIEEDLIRVDDEKEDQPVMIITGVAGTGKSTLLSHYYSEIKKTKPDYWVIRINLVEHSDAISKLDKERLDLIEFLINDLHVTDAKSPFSCSLLKHRLETGERIVFMFDGFDEVNGECQEIAIQLMKSIRKKKSIQLYVTTRPHMADHLQYELCQLAYSLENFNENDQIQYVASYWMKTLQLPENNKKVIEEFAKLLVTRVSETLKDKERAFIGIPLQCKILADCYLPHIEEIVRNNTGNDVTVQSADVVSQQLLSLLDNQKFDLISLYSQLMNTKRDIFQKEKTNGDTSNQIYANSLKQSIKQIELQLTKLAVETIITEPNTLQLFWPSRSYNSIEDEDEEEENLAKDCLRFGLTFSVGDGMRPQFLHRTFAEYFVAKYLYEGFILDDRRHNKLLENESIRKLIVNKIFAKKQYDGVQVFFDSMVKNLVDENEEWRTKIDDRKLPERLKKFAENLFTQLLRRSHNFHFIGNRKIGNFFTANALKFSFSKDKGNIFKLLCDCLEFRFEKKQVHWAMLASFIKLTTNEKQGLLLTSLPESKLFKRFIDLFDIDPDNPIMNEVVEKIIECFFPGIEVPCGSTFSLWNRDEHQQMMTHLIDFLAKQRVAFNKCCKPYIPTGIGRMLKFLVSHENYGSHLENFLKLLLQSERYSNDFEFAKLITMIFKSTELMPGQITKTLDILHKLGRHSLLVRLYGRVLTIGPEAFQNIYGPVRLEKDDVMLNDMDNLLKRDSYNMTHLHAAAFHGDIEIVNQILATIRQGGLDPDHETEVRRLLFERYTPFYLAAAGGHEKICCTILAFVKDIFPGELKCKLTKSDQFIHLSFNHAMKSDNVEMSRLILKIVKQELGHDYLIDFVKAKSIFDVHSSKEMWNAMAKIIVDRNGIVDYKYLDDFVFNTSQELSDVIEKLDAENMQGLLSLNGSATFTKRILLAKNSLMNGFLLLSRHVVPHFSKEQLLDVFQMITRNDIVVTTSDDDDSVAASDDETSSVHSERIVKKCSFWENLLSSKLPKEIWDYEYEDDEDSIIVCLTFVSDILGGGYAKQLLLHQDDDGYMIIHLKQKLIKRMLNCLPQKNQEEIKQEWKEKMPLMAHNSFIPLASRNDSEERRIDIAKHNINVLRFYLDYGSHVQLKECLNILTFVRFIDGQQYSVWSNIVENSGIEETNEMLESISKILGREAVSELLLQMEKLLPERFRSIVRNDVYGKAKSRWLEGLPQEIRDDIQQPVDLQTGKWIEEFISHQVYIDNEQFENYLNFGTLQFFKYCSNDEQRKQFVQNIMTLKISDEYLNIWADMLLRYPFWHNKKEIGTFLKSVMEKLGLNAVKDLVLHKVNDNPVICWVALKGNEKLLETMLTHLDAESRENIQRQVDEVLDRTFQIPSNGEVTDAMIKGLEYDVYFLLSTPLKMDVAQALSQKRILLS